MAALCYADKFVTERTDDVSEVLIEDSIDNFTHHRHLKQSILGQSDSELLFRFPVLRFHRITVIIGLSKFRRE